MDPVHPPDSDSNLSDSELFTTLYSKHERELYRFIASMLGQPMDADDLLQETAKKLWKEFPRYDRSKPFLPWACTIARFEVLSFWKRQKVKRKYFSEDVGDLLAQSWADSRREKDSRTIALEQCVEHLSPGERRLLDDRYSGEHSLKDLAKRAGTTPNALYKSLQRIRESLFLCVSSKLSLET